MKKRQAALNYAEVLAGRAPLSRSHVPRLIRDFGDQGWEYLISKCPRVILPGEWFTP